MSRCTTNKEAWQLLFDKYNILEEINQNGYFKITAKQINEYREARLMTKFDNSANLPELFKDNETKYEKAKELDARVDFAYCYFKQKFGIE